MDGNASEASARGDVVGSPARGEGGERDGDAAGQGRSNAQLAPEAQQRRGEAAGLAARPGGSSLVLAESIRVRAGWDAARERALAAGAEHARDGGRRSRRPDERRPPSRTRSHSSLGSGAVGGEGEASERNAAERAAERTTRNGGMRRTTTVSGELGSPPMEQPSFPPAFADPPESPVREAGPGPDPAVRNPTATCTRRSARSSRNPTYSRGPASTSRGAFSSRLTATPGTTTTTTTSSPKVLAGTDASPRIFTVAWTRPSGWPVGGSRKRTCDAAAARVRRPSSSRNTSRRLTWTSPPRPPACSCTRSRPPPPSPTIAAW